MLYLYPPPKRIGYCSYSEAAEELLRFFSRCWPSHRLGRDHFFKVIRFGHTQCNAKAQTSTKFNFRHAVNLVNKRYHDIERVVKVQSSDSRDPIFVFPGFEGRIDCMSPLIENIGRTIYCLQYPFEGSPSCTRKTAEITLPHLENCLNEVKKVNIVAHSFGGLIAIDLIKLLEAKGVHVRLCLTDSSPYALKVFGFHAFGDVYSAEFETNMIIVLLNSLQIKNVDQFHDVIESTGALTFGEKIEILSPMLAEFCPLDPTEIRLFCQGLFNLTKSMLIYDERFLKLKGQAALIRPDTRIWEFPDDYKISNYFEKPVPTFFTDGHHVSMLRSRNTAALINKIFDE